MGDVDMARKRKGEYNWDSRTIRALRDYLGMTQQEMSEELGTRQQTISEWETGVYRPRGGMARLLTLVAERVGFAYGEVSVAGKEERGEEDLPEQSS
jgi:DNA-binding transcriptional regulator YiaG